MACSAIIAAVAAVSCSKDVPAEPEMVLEGWIDEGGHPVVMLHNSVTFDEGFDNMEELVREKLIYFGKVTISDGGTSEVLTGRMDTAYLPPYTYSSVRIMGEAGKTYSVEAEYRGRKVSAVTTIPPRAEFDSLSVESVESKPGYVRLTGYLTDIDSGDDHYVVFYRYIGEKQYRNGFQGVRSGDAADPSGALSIPVYRNVSATSMVDRDTVSTRYFRLGDTLDVKVAAVDDVSYRFWESFMSITLNSSIPFLPVNENIYTNVLGGKGYWCGYGSSTYRLILERDTVLRWE